MLSVRTPLARSYSSTARRDGQIRRISTQSPSHTGKHRDAREPDGGAESSPAGDPEEVT